MKKVGLFLLAVVMVAGLAGCGGGDDDPNYVFAGRWSVSSFDMVTNCNLTLFQGEMTIAENEGQVIVTLQGSGLSRDQTGRGICDNKEGTILFDVPASYGGVNRWSGKMTSDNAMEGVRTGIGGNCSFEAKWRAIRL